MLLKTHQEVSHINRIHTHSTWKHDWILKVNRVNMPYIPMLRTGNKKTKVLLRGFLYHGLASTMQYPYINSVGDWGFRCEAGRFSLWPLLWRLHWSRALVIVPDLTQTAINPSYFDPVDSHWRTLTARGRQWAGLDARLSVDVRGELMRLYFIFNFFFSPVWERDREGKMVRMKGHRLLRPPPLMAKQTETQCQRASVASAGGKSGA